MSRKTDQKPRGANLDVHGILEEFKRHESAVTHRNGTFKIAAPFEQALDTILKAKPDPNKPRSQKPNAPKR